MHIIIRIYHYITHPIISQSNGTAKKIEAVGHCIRAPSNSPAAQALALALDVSNVNRQYIHTLIVVKYTISDLCQKWHVKLGPTFIVFMSSALLR